jgi:muramidase (phage lysozyme)
MNIDAKEKAFLDLIAWSEGAKYDTIVTGVDGASTFTDFSTHPFANGKPAILVREPCVAFPKGLYSTASGRYQLMLRWWLPYKTLLGLTDFSPASQDAIALQQIRERRAIALIEAGNMDLAVEACNNIWASFPGNNYGQGGRSLEGMLAQYQILLQGETNELKSAA